MRLRLLSIGPCETASYFIRTGVFLSISTLTWDTRVLPGNYLNNDNNYSQITNCQNIYTKKYWTVDNSSNTYARLSAQDPTGLAAPSRVVDRSFIRLENVSVAYNVPAELLSRFKIQNAKNICYRTQCGYLEQGMGIWRS